MGPPRRRVGSQGVLPMSLPAAGAPAHQARGSGSEGTTPIRSWVRQPRFSAVMGRRGWGQLRTETSKGRSVTLQLTFLWPNPCFWVALRGRPPSGLLEASPAVVGQAETGRESKTTAGPLEPWSPCPKQGASGIFLL